MASDLGGNAGRELRSTSANLAAELRRIIQELDAEQHPEAQEEITSGTPEDEVEFESPNLTTVIRTLKQDLEESSAESMVAIRLLHELIRVRHTELLNSLVRMEQSLQDEINLMERRIRGDIAALRTELGISAVTDSEERTSNPVSAATQSEHRN